MRKGMSKFRCCLKPEEVNDFLEKDSNRIAGRIAQTLALNSPWISFIDPYFKLKMDARELDEAWKILKKYYKKTK